VLLRPRTKAKRLGFAANLTTRDPAKPLDDGPVHTHGKETLIETLSHGGSKTEMLVNTEEGSTCAACCSGVSFDLDSIRRLDAIEGWEVRLAKLRARPAFAALKVDLSGFETGMKLTSVPALPVETITFEPAQVPPSPPASPPPQDGILANGSTSDEQKQNLSRRVHPPDYLQPHPPHKVFSAPILGAHRMTKDGASKRVYHMSIDVSDYPLGPGEAWLVGGSFGVCTANEETTIQAVLKACGETPETAKQPVLLKTQAGRWPTVWGDEMARELYTNKEEVIRWCSDISASPIKKTALRLLADYAKDPLEQQILLYLSARQGQQAFCALRSGDPITLPHLLEAFSSVQPNLAHLLVVYPQLMPRWYSLSSDPSQNHGTLEFAFTVAEVPCYKGVMRPGVGSGFLERLALDHINGERDGRLPMFRGLHANPFTKDFADTGPMILIGAGVGIAPFRGFVQRRVSSAKCAGKVYVIQGCRDSQFDSIYGNDLQTAEHCIVESQAGRREYVQDEVVRQGALIWRVMTREGGRIYVCGAAKGFLQGIERALRKVAVDQGLTEEEAKALFMKWQDPLDLRLILEVW
jgi:sulfite reductase alpha subunit-like flavoprotein